MTHTVLRQFCAGLLILTPMLSPLHAVAQDASSKIRHVNLPPSVELHYTIKANMSGFQVNGEAHLRWQTSGDSYQITTDSRAMIVGKILDASSQGKLNEQGLVPLSFTEKRLRRDATSTTFDRQAGRIRFNAASQTYPINGGEQDRISVLWQLIAAARTEPQQFVQGSDWTFFVAGQRDAQSWTFHVDAQESIRSPMGTLNTVRIHKQPPPDQQGQRIDIWLAPALEWYPVRIRTTEADGDTIEQSLASITNKVP